MLIDFTDLTFPCICRLVPQGYNCILIVSMMSNLRDEIIVLGYASKCNYHVLTNKLPMLNTGPKLSVNAHFLSDTSSPEFFGFEHCGNLH